MSPHFVQILGIAPLGFLLLDPDAPAPLTVVALFGLLITTAAGLIGRYLDNRRDQQRYERDEKRYELDRAERLANASAVRADLTQHRDVLKTAIAENAAAGAAEIEQARSSLAAQIAKA